MQTWGNNVIVLKICNLGVCILDLCKVNWLMYSILYKRLKEQINTENSDVVDDSVHFGPL